MTTFSVADQVAFLKLACPDPFWSITIKQDHVPGEARVFATRSFPTDDLTEVKAFLEKYSPDHNLYWPVNPPNRQMRKKAERQDLKELRYLHVDLDPLEGEDVEEERKRIYEALTTKLPAGVPEPTAIIDSGGGYWGIWALTEPMALDGSLAMAEEAKLYNLQLERLFNKALPGRADGCHNIDRIARLPGSVNYPDKRKLGKGRVEAKATLLKWDKFKTYDLDKMPKAKSEVVSTPSTPGFKGPDTTVNINTDIEPVEDLEKEIIEKYGVAPRIGVIINQGRVPEEIKEKDDSRSAWVFDAACGLARANVPDEIIYSIFTDPGFKISESILDKGAAAHKHAIRVIERAKIYAIDPDLSWLNQKFAVIGNLGGRCRIVEEILDKRLDRYRLSKISFEDFRNRFANKHKMIETDDGPKRIKLTKWWEEHPQRRQYDSLVFAPGYETPDEYNLWKGFGVEDIPGDCSMFHDHVLNNLCSGDQESYKYILDWAARMIQYPARPGEAALVFRGDQGTGKTMFARILGKLVGRHFLAVTDSKHLLGSFNAHLRDCLLLLADEAFYAGDKKHEGMLKTMVTEPDMIIENKGVDAEIASNYIHLIISSNSDWVVPVGGHERRFFVLTVSNEKRQDSKYFGKLNSQMENGGYEALLHELMHRDISNFNVRDFPRTEALSQQRNYSSSPEENWMFEKLQAGETLPGRGWLDTIAQADLYNDYLKYCQDRGLYRRVTQTVIVSLVLSMCRTADRRRAVVRRYYPDGTSGSPIAVMAFCFPPLPEARADWEERFGKTVWDEPAPAVQEEELDYQPEDEMPF